MNIYDGTYSWDGKKHGTREPITRFPGTYNLKIFNLETEGDRVTMIKPYLCVFSQTGKGHSILANPGRFAQYVSEAFSLEVERVLWTEEFPDNSGQFEIVVFSKSGKLGGDWFYKADRRSPTIAELALIKKEMGVIENA